MGISHATTIHFTLNINNTIEILGGILCHNSFHYLSMSWKMHFPVLTHLWKASFILSIRLLSRAFAAWNNFTWKKIEEKFSFNRRWWHQFSCLALQSCKRTQIVHLWLTFRRLFSTSLDGGLDGGLPRFALTTVWILVAIVGVFSMWHSCKHCKHCS